MHLCCIQNTHAHRTHCIHAKYERASYIIVIFSWFRMGFSLPNVIRGILCKIYACFLLYVAAAICGTASTCGIYSHTVNARKVCTVEWSIHFAENGILNGEQQSHYTLTLQLLRFWQPFSGRFQYLFACYWNLLRFFEKLWFKNVCFGAKKNSNLLASKLSFVWEKFLIWCFIN